jgi:hypothetical protein
MVPADDPKGDFLGSTWYRASRELVINIVAEHCEVRNSKARDLKQNDDQKVIFAADVGQLGKSVNVIELEVRRDKNFAFKVRAHVPRLVALLWQHSQRGEVEIFPRDSEWVRDIEESYYLRCNGATPDGVQNRIWSPDEEIALYFSTLRQQEKLVRKREEYWAAKKRETEIRAELKLDSEVPVTVCPPRKAKGC